MSGSAISLREGKDWNWRWLAAGASSLLLCCFGVGPWGQSCGGWLESGDLLRGVWAGTGEVLCWTPHIGCALGC